MKIKIYLQAQIDIDIKYNPKILCYSYISYVTAMNKQIYIIQIHNTYLRLHFVTTLKW